MKCAITLSSLVVVTAMMCCLTPAIAPEGISSGIFTRSAITLPSGLSVEEYRLKHEPTSEGGAEEPVFDPVTSSAKAIQKKHEKERMVPPTGRILGEGPLYVETIVTETGTGPNKVAVKLIRDKRTILNIPLGDSSPVEPLQGLWAYQNHWVLEVAHCSTREEKGIVYTDCYGEIIQDGESFNKLHGYQETFGFQLMGGKPFYFFKKDHQIGISYDNQQVRLEYSEIPHYHCCEPARLDPVLSKNMVSFLARRESKWYYVEIGMFK